jgi:hypothetical protein
MEKELKRRENLPQASEQSTFAKPTDIPPWRDQTGGAKKNYIPLTSCLW